MLAHKNYYDFIGHLVLYNQNCPILDRTRIVWIDNSAVIPVHISIPELLTYNSGRTTVPILSVNYLPDAGEMTPLIKDFAANFHLYSFLPELPGA